MILLLSILPRLVGVVHAVRSFVFCLHVLLYFVALSCLCPAFDIVDLFCDLPTPTMTFGVCKESCFTSKFFWQLVYALSSFMPNYSFSYDHRLILSMVRQGRGKDREREFR